MNRHPHRQLALGLGLVALITACAAPAFADEPKKAEEAPKREPRPPKVMVPPGSSTMKVVPQPVPAIEPPPVNTPNANTPTPIPPAGQPGAIPQQPEALELKEKSFEWGDISDLEPVEHAIHFKNTTDRTIKITAAASCGCTVTSMEKNEYAAGEEGKVIARFDPHGRSGLQTKTITFTITDPPSIYSLQMVNVSANVKALVTFDPIRIFMNEVDHREGKVEHLKITGRKPGFAVTSAESSSEFVKVKVLDAKPATSSADAVTEIPVEITVGKGAPIGSLQASITFAFNDERVKNTPYFLGADVVGELKCTPPQVLIRINQPLMPFSNEMRLDSRTGSPFKVTGIDIDARKDMQVVADVKPGEGGKFFMITVSGVTPNEQGMFTGAITVTAEGTDKETVRIPISAAVSKPLSQSGSTR